MDIALCRLLPCETADGPTNMAADAVLLESAIAGVASLRFYGWSQPTLSLGYFQTAAERLRDPLVANLPWVRRPSGGGALVHDVEATYALALPAGLAWQRRGESWLRRMHEVLAAALRECGANVEIAAQERKLGEFLCFQHQTLGDVVLNGHKVVGSAQRKSRGAMLQHGAILLGASAHAPQLPGLAEQTGAAFQWSRSGIVERLRHVTGWNFEPSVWTEDERRRMADLAESRFRSAAWNERR